MVLKLQAAKHLKYAARIAAQFVGRIVVSRVAERRCPALASLRDRPLRALHRVMSDGILVEQGGEGGQPLPDGRCGQPAAGEFVAPGDDVSAGDGAKFLRPLDASKPHEVLGGGLVRAAGGLGAQVGEPLHFRGTSARPWKAAAVRTRLEDVTRMGRAAAWTFSSGPYLIGFRI